MEWGTLPLFPRPMGTMQHQEQRPILVLPLIALFCWLASNLATIWEKDSFAPLPSSGSHKAPMTTTLAPDNAPASNGLGTRTETVSATLPIGFSDENLTSFHSKFPFWGAAFYPQPPTR